MRVAKTEVFPQMTTGSTRLAVSVLELHAVQGSRIAGTHVGRFAIPVARGSQTP